MIKVESVLFPVDSLALDEYILTTTEKIKYFATLKFVKSLRFDEKKLSKQNYSPLVFWLYFDEKKIALSSQPWKKNNNNEVIDLGFIE